ncbi:MAG: hypothetical protein AAGF11_49960 [Myxococcota bacterium]
MSIECQDVQAALRRGEMPEPDALTEHVEDCPVCEALVAAQEPLAGALRAPDEPFAFDELLAEVDAAIERDQGARAWLHSQPTPWRMLLAVLGAAIVPVAIMLTWGRVDLGVYPTNRWVVDLFVLIAPLALALVVVLRPVHRPAWPRWVEPVAVGLGVLAVLVGPMLVVAHQDHPASLGGTGPDLWRAAAVCLGLGTAMGLPLVPWLTALRRQGEGWSQPTLLAAVGAGITGVLAIFMHCPIVAPEHLLLGHATVLVPFVVLGLWGLRR